MEDSKESSTSDSVSENTENQDLEQTEDIPITDYLCRELHKLKQVIGDNMGLLNHFEKFIVSVETSQFLRPDEELSDSPMVSPIHEPQDLPDPPISADHTGIIYGITAAMFQALKEESNEQSDDESQSAITGTKSGESDVSKGKEAENKKFRYKKGSKPEVSSIEALSEETTVEPAKEALSEETTVEPVKEASCEETTVEPAKEASSAPEIKNTESQSSKADTTRIKPAVKRKSMDSDESCSTWTSNLSGTCADDNAAIQLAKKLKFDDDGKASIECPTITTLISHEGSVASEYIAQSQTDQNRHESEPIPSTSGLSRVVSYGSSSDESTIMRLIDYFPSSEKEESSVASGSTDATPSESIDSTSTNVSIDVSLGERPESSLKSSSDFSEIFATSTSDEASLPNTDES